MKLKRRVPVTLCVGHAILHLQAFAEIKPVTDLPASWSVGSRIVTTPTRERIEHGLKYRTDTTAQLDYSFSVCKAEILEELPKLTPAERQEVRLKLAALDGAQWIDAADPLTDAEKALLDARLAAYEEHSDVGSSWEEVEARIRARLKA